MTNPKSTQDHTPEWTPPAEAVEAAAAAMYEANAVFHRELNISRGREVFGQEVRVWADAPDYHRDLYRVRATAALTAARDALVAEVRAGAWDEGHDEACHGTPVESNPYRIARSEA